MAAINQVYSLLNNSIKQIQGVNAVEITDERSLISVGEDTINSMDAGSKEIFTKTLTDMITDTIYVSNKAGNDDLGVSKDTNGFNGIKRKVRVIPGELVNNTEYDLTAESNFNPFSIEVPAATEQIFKKFGTVGCDVFIPDNQLFTAFNSNADAQNFYSLIYQKCDNQIIRAEKAFDRLAIANFIAEKIHLQTTQAGQGKMHAVNLLALYNADHPDAPLTKATCKGNPEFLRFFTTQFSKFRKLMEDDTAVFNSSTGDHLYPSKTYAEEINAYVLNEIDANLPGYLYSDTYHKELVTLNNYKVVNAWQGIGKTGFDFDSCSKVHVNLASDGTEVEQSGVIALLCHKDAISTFYDRSEAETWRVPTKGTKYHRAITREMINDTVENAVVFYVAD